MKAKTYHARMRSVLEHIHHHLHDKLSVDILSRIACFSPYHFHRQFFEYTGINVYKYIQLIRLKRASYELVFRHRYRITDIALRAGFENVESFSRAFKKVFGDTPSRFRNKPVWPAWRRAYEPLKNRRIIDMTEGKHDGRVKLVEFSETRVAALPHRGAPARLNDTIADFIAWRKESKLSPATSEIYNIIYDDPETTSSAAFRIDICASINADVGDNSYGVIGTVIPGGRCAVLRHTGADENIGESLHYLYAEWLPESGEELRDFPCFFHRVTLFPDVPEHEMITDIYLPLK